MTETASDTLHIRVEYFTGHEEEEDVGYPYYVAACEEIVAVTEGRTWRELMQNIALEAEDTVAAYNVIPRPRIIITMELPDNYAEIA